MSFVSTTHPSMPSIKGNIRAETHIAGYIMKPSPKDPSSTDLCILSQVDIKVYQKFGIHFVGEYSKNDCKSCGRESSN